MDVDGQKTKGRGSVHHETGATAAQGDARAKAGQDANLSVLGMGRVVLREAWKSAA